MFDDDCFLELKAKYVCPNCGQVIEFTEQYFGDTDYYDSGKEIECACGLVFEINFNFDEEM